PPLKRCVATTSCASAVFATAILLAGMRNRARPTPYDFQDAAVTCLEKDVVPGRRDVRRPRELVRSGCPAPLRVARLCELLLGGDRVAQAAYDALPPLARDVLDRLGPLGVDL